MKITAANLEKLTWQAKIDLLLKIVNGAIDLDEVNDECQAIDLILETVLETLDEADNDDRFGTEGWRHGILGED